VSDTQEQFEQVFQGCFQAVNRYAARRVAPEAVQDVVSDTFLVAWRRHGELDGEPLPCLLGIARRVAANHLRGSTRRDALHERLRGEHPAGYASEEMSEHDPQLATALAGLGERDREALMLVAWDGLEHHVAAQVMGCSTGAFTVRVHRAKRRLARALASEETDSIEIPQEARSPL
jgi:RNA polymerase sigma-70 factor (ECF subfamily)